MMLKSDARACDVCGEKIPKGQKFRRETIGAEYKVVVEQALSAPRDGFTWTENEDGSVSLDICLVLYEDGFT